MQGNLPILTRTLITPVKSPLLCNIIFKDFRDADMDIFGDHFTYCSLALPFTSSNLLGETVLLVLISL